MSDVIHLDPTGIGVAASPDAQIASDTAQRNTRNAARLTACGLKLSDKVVAVGPGRSDEVTCPKCLGRDDV